jgi:hypothetical protein
MLMVPSSKGAFYHPVVKNFSVDDIMVTSNPLLFNRPNADFESGFLAVLEGTSS